MLNFRTVWVTRHPGRPPVFDLFPVTDQRDGGETVYVTQDPAAFEGVLPQEGAWAVDVLVLYAFAFPGTPAEQVTTQIRQGPHTGEAIGVLWQAVAARLNALPLWTLESIEGILRNLDEHGLARVFSHFAACVRQAGVGCGPWIETFAPEARRGDRRALPEHADCSPLDVAAMAAHLLPGGAFARLMPGYEPRAGQVEMLHAVTRAFNEGRHLLVEAGTGVGKSLAYLIPAAAWALLNDVPVVVSTNTRNLQAQLIENDLPRVREAVCPGGRAALRVAVVKGRSNHFCLRRLAILLEQSQYELDRPEWRHFAYVLAWAAQTPDGDLDTFAGPGRVDAEFLAKLASTAEECPGRACRYSRRCFLQRARARAAAAHVVIANHALVFAESRAPGTALPPHAQIVFDEAHNLEEAATRHLSTEITQTRLTQLLRRLSRGRGRRAGGMLEVLRNHLEKGAVTADPEYAQALRRQIREIRNVLEEVQAAARQLFESLHGLIQPEPGPVRFRCVPCDGPDATVWPTGESALAAGNAGQPACGGVFPSGFRREVFRDKRFTPCPDAWDEDTVQMHRIGLKNAIAEASGLLLALGEALRQATEGELALYDDQAANVEGAAASLRTYAMDLDFVLAAYDAEHVFWAEPPSRSAGTAHLYAAPLRIGEALAETLYRRKATVVFCSATLRVGNSFGYISRRLGIDRLEPDRLLTCVAASPFDYLTQCAALAPVFLPEPTGGTGGTYAEQLSGLMLDVFTRTRGRAMGLFTSYEMMNRVARLLEEPLQEAGIRLLVHGTNGSRDQITRIFRTGGNCVLLGTHSFWEGVDVAGEALSCVVMARLPFAAVTDPIVEARCEQIEDAGGCAFREFSLPQAVIRFRQGFGRLIRTRADRGVVIIADPRVVTKSYGATFRKSLPCPLLRVETREELLRRVEALFAESAMAQESARRHGAGDTTASAP
ncbi:MAG TPA: helicase C-terminal domain-containing protein [Kiritimatiellia bacterium]|jgi:ATP-dependent DNA helicase DinG|nr:helicase C-terminal domain-containing protein [Kiritimatiellia bacterium]HRU20042.1 helicase C-terminal domain-containing protein [Kiritimatiellia bacterium]